MSKVLKEGCGSIKNAGRKGFSLAKFMLALVIMISFGTTLFASSSESWYGHLYGGTEGEGFQAKLDQITNSKRIKGNEVVFFPEAKADYQMRLKMMDEAKNHIHCYTLLLRADGITGPETAVKLIAKAALDGVEANFIYQPISQVLMTSPSIITAMSVTGVNCRAYWPKNVNVLNLYRYILVASHKKLLQCDSEKYGLVAMVGGRNIGDEYLCDVPNPIEGRFPNQWRDTDQVMYGPVNYELEQSFIFSFNEQSAKKKKLDPADAKYKPAVSTPTAGSDVELRVVENEPDRNNGKGFFYINELYKELFRTAKYSIDIETPYFIPTDEFQAELIKAANRGVKIRVLTNSGNTNDNGAPLYFGGAYFWKALLETGNIQIYLWDIKEEGGIKRTMHSKILLVDGAMVVPGSWNFEARSIIWNNEFAFPITNPSVAQGALKMFENDLKTNGEVFEVTLDKYASMFTQKDMMLMYFLSKLNNFL